MAATATARFVGRGSELRILRAELASARAGEGRLVLIEGEAGIGKTCIASALAAEARAAGTLVAWGRCHEGDSAPAYWPWVGILRECLAESAGGSAEIGALLEELRSRGAERGEAPHPDERFELLDRVAQALSELARKQPLLIAIDDLQWADVGSLQLLDFAARELRPHPLLLLATIRRPHSSGDAARERLLGSLGRSARSIPLAGLDAGAVGSSPNALTAAGATLHFTATEPGVGTELWKSDGTGAGTLRVRDINAGAGNALQSFALLHWNAASGTLLFGATNGAIGTELWKSDGTEAGTVLVKDIRSGTGGGYPSSLTDVNGTLFFRASDGEIASANGPTGSELWKSDGTEAGTVLVRDIRPGPSSSNPNLLTKVAGTLFFTADDGATGTELWKSDGTEAGTVQVLDIFPGSGGSSPSWLAAVGGILYFAASDGTNGIELWRSDGTGAGTVLVRDIRTGSSSSSPLSLTDLNGTLIFRANDGATGTELWASDGTLAGTVLVRDIWPGASTGIGITQGFTVVGGIAFFGASDGVAGSELWRTDATTAGSVLVRDINPGAGGSVPTFPTVLPVALGGELYFVASDGTSGHEPWRSDGTEAGTVLVRDVNPGALAAFGNAGTGQFQVLGTTLYFPATDGVAGSEPWKSDGTSPGTQLVRDVFPGATSGLDSTSWQSAVGSKVIFAATDDTAGKELWITDGSAQGTLLFADIAPGAGGSSPAGPYVVSGSNLFFSAQTDAFGLELWALPLSALDDADGDGLDDATELSLGTDPNDADSDDDGLDDGDEVNVHGTNPLEADTDGDGFDDPVELAAGTDPLDPDSFPAVSAVPALSWPGAALLAGALALLGARHALGRRPLRTSRCQRNGESC